LKPEDYPFALRLASTDPAQKRFAAETREILRGPCTRPATRCDARKLGLVPHVTNILGVVAKPEVTLWLQEQAVLAALTLPRNAGEGEAEFAQRVVADAQTERVAAANFGSAFHHGAERAAQTLEAIPPTPQRPG
jgi:hypothetical protein